MGRISPETTQQLGLVQQCQALLKSLRDGKDAETIKGEYLQIKLGRASQVFPKCDLTLDILKAISNVLKEKEKDLNTAIETQLATPDTPRV